MAFVQKKIDKMSDETNETKCKVEKRYEKSVRNHDGASDGRAMDCW
jgi:hypothetical protein